MKKIIALMLTLCMILSFSCFAAADEAETCDVVVIGAGGSGIIAACTAFDAGKDVIVLEKMPIIGGNTNLATTQMWAAGSSMQKELGQTETAEDFYNFIMTGKGAGLGLDPDATMQMCERSGEMVDWLLDNHVEFGRVFNIYSHGPADGGAPGPVIMAGLTKALDERGIDYRTENRVTSILMEDGKAAGVEVKTKDGSYTINADAVIIATGGFANNSEMVAKYDPRWSTLGCNSSVSQTGDGIIMAEALNAKLDDMSNITINSTVYYRGENQLYSLTALRTNGAIMVNNSGKRFVSEETNYTAQSEALLAQDNQDAFLIFDQSMVDSVGLVSKYNDLGFFVKGDTIEELAAALGIDAEGLSAQIEEYQGFIANGEDAAYGRQFMNVDYTNAPFYGVKVYPSVQTTSGGIVINLASEVIDNDGNVIPGLYSCGAATCDGTRAVSPLTKAFVTGRIAGESAVAFVG